jgi:hypothetical protein
MAWERVGQTLKAGIPTMHEGREAVLHLREGNLPMHIRDLETGEIVALPIGWEGVEIVV